MSDLLCTTLITRGPRSGQRCLEPVTNGAGACRKCTWAQRDRATLLASPDTDRDRAAKALLERMQAEISARGRIEYGEED